MLINEQGLVERTCPVYVTGLIDELKAIKDGIVEGYVAKTKMDPEKMSKLMKDETWMTASEAVAFGFADEVISGPNKAPANKVSYANFLQALYMNVPQALLPSRQLDAVNVNERKAQRLAAQAKSFLVKE